MTALECPNAPVVLMQSMQETFFVYLWWLRYTTLSKGVGQ